MQRSMKLAVIKAGGKQYVVTEGSNLVVEKIAAEQNAKVTFETLLTANDDGSSLSLGAPSLGDKVTVSVAGQLREDKVSVVKFKSKVRYRRNVGHRQPKTSVTVESIK